MYQEFIMDYYRNPRNFGTLPAPQAKHRDTNPLCGDAIEIQLTLDSNGTITAAKFNGKGCAISQAATSMLTEFVIGKKTEEIQQMGKEDILDMLGIPISFVRLKCALLGLKVLKMSVYDYLGQKYENGESE